MTGKKIRFIPDNDEVAYISFNLNEFKKDLPALLIDESVHGACLVINGVLVPKEHQLNVGMIFLAQIGALKPLRVQVKWFKEIDSNIFKIGVEMLE